MELPSSTREKSQLSVPLPHGSLWTLPLYFPTAYGSQANHTHEFIMLGPQVKRMWTQGKAFHKSFIFKVYVLPSFRSKKEKEMKEAEKKKKKSAELYCHPGMNIK